MPATRSGRPPPLPRAGTDLVRAAITGATGFIGTHLTRRLAAEGIATRVLSRRANTVAARGRAPGQELWPASVEVVRGDIHDRGALRALVSGCELVYHLAALTRAATEARLFSVNVGGTSAIVDAIGEAAPARPHLILMSSQAAVGPSPLAAPLDEHAPAKPISRYGRSKRAGERVAAAAARRGIPVTIIRPPSVYGPGERDILTYFRLVSRGVIPVMRREPRVSLVYVGNLVDALMAAAAPQAAPLEPRLLHVADDAMTMSELGQMVATALGRRARRLAVPLSVVAATGYLLEAWSQLAHRSPVLNRDRLRELRQPAWLLASHRLERLLGHTPRVGTAAAVAETARWYVVNGWL